MIQTKNRISREDFEEIKRIEKLAYPPEMQEINNSYDNYEDIEDYIGYHDGEICFYLDKNKGSSWYIIVSVDEDEIEIIDLASENMKLSLQGIMKISMILRDLGGEEKEIVADLRHKTSYPLVRKLVEIGKLINFKSDSPWMWEDEEMFPCSFKLKPQIKSFIEWLKYR